jgi:steroid delta-isomerase-like uncharacterized protein
VIEKPIAPETLDHESAREAVVRVYELLNRHDLGQIPVVFTEDVVFDEDIWPETISGHSQMERFYAALWRAMPDFRFELVEGPYLAQGGRGVAARVRMGGTFSGTFDPPGYTPTGTRVTTEFGSFLEFEGNRIKRGRVILNVQDVAVQVGAAPRRGGLADRLGVRMQHFGARLVRRRATH